jgi:hypothetical protein
VKHPETPLVRFGAQFTTVQMFLDDVRLDVERQRGRPLRPFRPGHRSLSLVGELALAVYERMLSARSVVVCRYCLRTELSPDTRPRFTCGREECQAAYRREWKQQHPEDPQQVARRVRKHRQKKGVQR